MATKKLKIGNKEINNIYLGATPVKEAYLGADLIFRLDINVTLITHVKTQCGYNQTDLHTNNCTPITCSFKYSGIGITETTAGGGLDASCSSTASNCAVPPGANLGVTVQHGGSGTPNNYTVSVVKNRGGGTLTKRAQYDWEYSSCASGETIEVTATLDYNRDVTSTLIGLASTGSGTSKQWYFYAPPGKYTVQISGGRSVFSQTFDFTSAGVKKGVSPIPTNAKISNSHYDSTSNLTISSFTVNSGKTWV